MRSGFRSAALGMTFMLAACVPSFNLDKVTFPEDRDAQPASDAANEPDSGMPEPDSGPIIDATVTATDAGTLDSEVVRDAEPLDATPEDATIDAGEPEDAGERDAGPDCRADSGVCDDDNVCTDDACDQANGHCLRTNNTMQDTVAGWRCEGGIKHETQCLLTSGDEDGDTKANCADSDCCAATACLGMMCPQ
jgi:hypothetical protein